MVCLRRDNGTEYTVNEFDEFVSSMVFVGKYSVFILLNRMKLLKV